MARNLRLSEHEREIKRGVLTTALAKRAYEYDVKIEWENAKIIKQLRDMNELTVVEEVQIFAGSDKGKVINEKQSINLSQAWSLH